MLSDAIIEQLVGHGVTTVFGIPGGPVGPFFVSAKRKGMTLIESKQETSAVFEAMAYHLATGRIPLVLVTSGPGVTNSLTGLASAFERRIPLLLVAGDVSWEKSDRHLIQKSDYFEQVTGRFCSKTYRIRSVQGASGIVHQALDRLSAEVAQGPVCIVCPIHLARAATGEPMAIVSGKSHEIGRHMDDLARRLDRSRSPLLILGQATRNIRERILAEIVAPSGIPFVTTVQAKGLYDETHELSLRNIGLATSLWAKEYAREADLILALGTDLDDCSIGPVSFHPEAFVAHVDADSTVFGKNLRTHVAFNMTFDRFLHHWREHARQVGGGAERRERIGRFKSSTAMLLDKRSSHPELCCPQSVIEQIQKRFFEKTEGARLVTDIGEHMLFALHYFTSRGKKDFEIFIGHGSMGSGITSSIGFALADPSRPVVCVCGDGGMQMNGMEILLAQKMKLPVVFAVFNDARYNMVFHGMNGMYDENVSWETHPVDFAAWAASMGVAGRKITSARMLEEIDWDETISRGPCVLDIAIDRSVKMGGGRNDLLKHMSGTE